MDLSFISLRLIIPVVAALLTAEGEMICLVKPQFEAGRENVGKKGVVRDPKVHIEVLEGFADFVQASGLSLTGLTHSPIRGPEGNIEFLARLCTRPQSDIKISAPLVVEKAHGDESQGSIRPLA
jgi:23S rRNA (cytidine1920-2'-O)/16S rRNA (cytidine1409-2'-O)-methyltransferase